MSRFIIGSDLAFELEMTASTQNNILQLENGNKNGNTTNSTLLLENGETVKNTSSEETALVPYIRATLTSQKGPIQQMLWKHFWISFVISPPGGEATALCDELARKRGYIHISLDQSITREISESTDLGNELITSSTKTSIENVTSDICGTLIFGTVSGRIGVIARLSEVQFQFLLQLQSALNEVITSVGNLSHDEWRSFHNDRRYTLQTMR